MSTTTMEGTATRPPAKQRLVGVVLVLVISAVALGSEWARLRITKARSSWPPEVDALYLPPATAMRLASMGHREVVADLLAARVNIYFGDQLSQKGAHRWMSWYLNAITDLDPYFEPIYKRGAVMLTYSTSKMTTANVLTANKLLERGIAFFPESWELYFQLGFNLAYELPATVSADDPRRIPWRKEGLEALRKATLFDDVPMWLPNLVAGMLSKSGEREMAIKHLERIYATTSDEETRAQIKEKLNQLLGEHYARSFETQAKLLRRIRATRFPYAPEAFSIIMGRRFRPYSPLEEVLVDPATLPAPESTAKP